MTRRHQLALAVGLPACLAAITLGLAASPPSGGSVVTLYAGGHPFGIGEQQVYLIDRTTTLTVHYRDRDGRLRSKDFHYHAQTSVAWTIEGITSTGDAILGVTTAAPTASAAPTTPPPIAFEVQASPAPPKPSPTLDARGTTVAAADTAIAELAPGSLVLSALSAQLPEVGQPWKSSGALPLPFGTLRVAMDNTIVAPDGAQAVDIAQIASSGTTSFNAKVKVPGFGNVALRGAGAASATSYIETQMRVLLGMTFTATSHGNATTGTPLPGSSATNRPGVLPVLPTLGPLGPSTQQDDNGRGSYELQTTVALKLVRYVPGIVPYTGTGGFVPASGYLGGTSTPDMGIYATTRPDGIAIPAATDTGFIPPPAPAPPYQSALPAVPLPPIPLPMTSDQPAASPPAAPTPTPQPTHY